MNKEHKHLDINDYKISLTITETKDNKKQLNDLIKSLEEVNKVIQKKMWNHIKNDLFK